MPAIEIQARSYASVAEMRAAHRAARARLIGPVPRRELAPLPTPPQNVEPVPHQGRIIGDDEYARLLLYWSPPPLLQRPHAAQVAEIVSRDFGIRVAEMIGQARRKIIIIPRHVAMYICVKGLGYSYPEAGRYLGGRDHTTVLNAVRKITWRMSDDPAFADRVAQLMRACGCQNTAWTQERTERLSQRLRRMTAARQAAEGNAGKPAEPDYDPAKDVEGCFNDAYAAIRQRMATGGPGWVPK